MDKELEEYLSRFARAMGEGKDIEALETLMDLVPKVSPETVSAGGRRPAYSINPFAGAVMSDEVTLSVDHGTHRAGTSFEVVRKAKTTTIVHTSMGNRIIIPNNKLVGGDTDEGPSLMTQGDEDDDSGVIIGDPVTRKAVVELNEDQFDLLANLKAKSMSLGDMLTEYSGASGLSESDAKADLLFIDKHIDDGSTFTAPPTPKAPASLGSSMSEKEQRVLEAVLAGNSEALNDPSLGVSEDILPEEKEEEPVLGANQIWFTDITGGRLPKSGINYVIQQYADDHFPEEHRVHIPDVDPRHFWSCEALEALVLAHGLREKALLTGLPGVGKSSSVKQFGAWIRQPYMRLGGRGDLESSSFLGYSWADIEEHEGQMVSKMAFKPGMLTQGCMYGYLTTIDEVMKIPPYIQMAMQHLYEKDGHLTIDDKPGTQEDKIVRPASEFLMILTDNVKGTGDSFDKFASTQMQDTSTLDRININETIDYLELKDEVSMLMGMYPKADKTLVTKLVKFAGLVRNGYKQGSIALVLSPRGLIAIMDVMTKNVPVGRALELAFINKIADETEIIAIQEMIRTVNL
jgi:MoxR-like ATPase